MSLLHEKYHKKPSLDGEIRHKRDLIFFNSRGDVISYTSSGTKRWSLRTGSSWHRSLGEGPGEHAHPSLLSVQLREGYLEEV